MAIGLTIWGLRSDAIQEANNDTGNIAAVLSEQLARSIQSVDIVLSDVRERVEQQYASAQVDFDQRIRSQDFYRFLRERLDRLSQADFIAVIDRDGQIAITTQPSPPPKMNVTDRDYFQHFERDNDNGIYISSLLTSRTTG